MFVHGVSTGFLDVGTRVRAGTIVQHPTRIYFLGKALWSKGYRELLDALSHAASTGHGFECDVYGKGEHLGEIQAEADDKNLQVAFHGAKDHLDPALHTFKIFINPSTSDVVATTSAEALAMNKWLVCQRHPCNTFFEANFANTLVYDDLDGFVACVDRAMANAPAPLTDEERRLLTWEDACDRLLAVVGTDVATNNAIKSTLESLTYTAYSKLLGIELIRRAVGAGRNTKRDEGEAELTAQLEELAQLETYPQGCY